MLNEEVGWVVMLEEGSVVGGYRGGGCGFLSWGAKWGGGRYTRVGVILWILLYVVLPNLKNILSGGFRFFCGLVE